MRDVGYIKSSLYNHCKRAFRYPFIFFWFLTTSLKMFGRCGFLVLLLIVRSAFTKVTLRHIDTLVLPESIDEPPQLDVETVEQLVVDADDSIIYTAGQYKINSSIVSRLYATTCN